MTTVGSGKVSGRKVGSRRQTRSLLSEFLDALALEGRSPHSVRSYRRDLEPAHSDESDRVFRSKATARSAPK